jgi:hypothetical protein
MEGAIVVPFPFDEDRISCARVAQVVLDLGSRFRPQVEFGDANDVAR